MAMHTPALDKTRPADSLATRSRALTAWLLFAGFFGLLCAHAWQYYPFIADDALVTLRYAERLLRGEGLTWTAGRPVEGYSNLLWLLLTAALGRLGLDLIDAVRLLGLMCMAAVLWALARNAQDRLPLLAALLFFTAAAPVAVWTVGGLEQPLYIALLAFAIPLTTRLIDDQAPRPGVILRLSLLLGAMCITRPDGPLFTAAAVFAVYAGRWLSAKPMLALREMALLLALPCLFYGGQTGFRLWYYGEWVANTALVKIAPSWHHFQGGLKYLMGGMAALAPLSWLAVLLAVLLAWGRPTVGLPLVAMGGLWAGYLVFIGGDVFRVYRHILPLVVVFAFAISGGLQWLTEGLQARLQRSRAKAQAKTMATAVAAVAMLALFIPYLHTQAGFLAKGYHHTWVWDGRITALLLKQAFGERQPLMAIGAAGGMAYWSELPVIDTHGLNDYHIPRIRPPDLGQGWIGHEFGDADYVLSRKPDLMVWHTGRLKNPYRTGRQLEQREAFHRLYTVVRVRGVEEPRRRPRTAAPLRRLFTALRGERQARPPRAHHALIRVRKYDSKLGVTISDSQIHIPAYLFNEYAHTVAYLDPAGKLVIAVSAAQPAAVSIDTALLAGQQAGADTENWQATVLPPSAALAARISRQGGNLSIELTSPTATVAEVTAVTLHPLD